MRRAALVGFGVPGDAAWDFLRSLPGVTARRLAFADLAGALGETDLLWIHTEDEPPPLPAVSLRSWIEAGGRLLLTQRAASRVVGLGLDPDGPNDQGARVWENATDELWFAEFRSFGEFPHVRGLAAYGPHPLFAGVDQGTYVWAPTEGERFAYATYVRGRRPVAGHVVACERSYIHLNADRIVAWEYAAGQGGVLCIGAFVALHAPNPLLARQLRAVLTNALAGDAIPHHTRASPARHWPKPGDACRPDPDLVAPALPSLDGAFPGLDSPLHAETRALSDEAYTLAGRRAVVLGGEQAGVREIWMHPYRVLRDLQVTQGGETPLVRDAQITPSVVQRHLVSRTRLVEEAVTTALDYPIVLLDYRPEKIGRARGLRIAPELSLRWQVDLRRMWPYAAGCGGDLRWRRLPGDCGLLVADTAGLAHVLLLTNQPVEWTVRGDTARPVLTCGVRVQLEEPLRLAVVGGVSAADVEAAAAALGRRGVSGIAGRRRRHEEQLREYLVRLRSPDELLNTAFEWAKVRLDAALVDTPGIGRSLVAGYAASRPGWGDGRPGYAWYFGRDACWSGLALLGVGDFAGARLVLRFLGQTQDVSGKVIHEYATSGLAHYDAADSTPLYLLLAGRYAAWSGDLAFLEERWGEIERAYRFCLGTDTDGDGLIENTRVGHGWIEMGPLSGAHVTLYLASIWIAACEALRPVAAALGRTALAEDLAARAARARATVALKFRLPDGLALGLLADGTRQSQRTALTAVALLLGTVEAGHETGWLDAMATTQFSAPWGVRLLSSEDPLYNPAAYHLGAVWPLYTGWVSLAEYACHRAEQAFRHLAANGRLPFVRAQGAFDEVLNGSVEIPAGVCPDQTWSAALLVSPVVEGMLGLRPDAMNQRAILAPHLPASWRECEWRGLHVGRTVFDVRVSGRRDCVGVQLRRTAGPPLDLVVRPGLPAGMLPLETTVDDHRLTPRLVEELGCRHAEVGFELRADHELEVRLRPE